MKRYHFSVVIEKDKDGHYAFCPELQAKPGRTNPSRAPLVPECLLI